MTEKALFALDEKDIWELQNEFGFAGVKPTEIRKIIRFIYRKLANAIKAELDMPNGMDYRHLAEH